MGQGRRPAGVVELEQKNEAKRLSRETLLTSQVVTKEIEVSTLGGQTVKVRSLTLAQRKEIQEKSKYGTPEFNEDTMTLLGIVTSIIEPELTEADVEALKNQDAAIIDELSMQISLLNMVGRADELKKESRETPNSD